MSMCDFLSPPKIKPLWGAGQGFRTDGALLCARPTRLALLSSSPPAPAAAVDSSRLLCALCWREASA